MAFSILFALAVLIITQSAPWASCLRYDPEQTLWNLNQNQTATEVLDYWGQWENHTYNPSPENWRFPFYTVMLDRFVNGDPENDDINGTAWEQDPYGTQLRFGGDIQGLSDTLDYICSMGVKGIYLAGSPMVNFPWASDMFSPLDLTLLDAHFATIDVWRMAINEMHSRGMYVIFDNTMATLGDLIGFENYLNVSTPILYGEHNALWKGSRRYHDFSFGNTEQQKCETEYPRWWNDFGEQVTGNGTENLIGCRDSDFDQYGDIAAFDKLPGGSEWQRQISKFASVQDRLREWKPSIREKIQHLSCIQISMLDLDGFRMDKGQQITVDAQGEFSDHIRQCARSFNKTNFFIAGEIVSGNAFGAIYLGRGKEPAMAVNDTTEAIQLTTETARSNTSLFLRAEGKNAFDAACFHYSTYRALTRFLGMDGDLGADGETPVDFIDAWNDFIRTNDLINPNTGVFDPRHMYGAQNQDVFRWPTIELGTYKQLLANFITTLLLPGIPMLEWGEEQAYYLLDNTANNYVFGRQAMSSSTAWQDHGCYSVGNAKFATWPSGNYSIGCKDDWNSLDHRDPSHPIKNVITSMFEMRLRYPVLADGFWLETISKQTHPLYLPGSLGTPTETGLWSVRRAGWPDITVLGQKFGSNNIWIVFHNEGTAKDYVFDCGSGNSGLLAPFNSGTTVKNLLYPYETVKLGSTPQKLKMDNETDVNGCVNSMSLGPFGYKAYVPIDEWLRPSPVITYFSPGHDSRILSNSTVPFELRFSDEMDCQRVQSALSLTSTTEDGSVPQIQNDSISCAKINDTTVRVSKNTGPITGQISSEWKISGNLVNVSDGIHRLTVANTTTLLGNSSTNSVNHFLFRIGQQDNPMVFPRNGNYSNSLLYRHENGSFYITHKAPGADKFRYSLNWGSTSFSDWLPYGGGNSTLAAQPWSGAPAQQWSGQHVIVQYWSQKAGSSNHIQQGDLAGTDTVPRRFPNVFLHGGWNQYGYDSGIAHTMAQDKHGIWNYDFMDEWPSQIQMNVWGSNPDGQPDLTRAYGDVDLDGVLDLLSPVSLLKNVVNITAFPPAPHLAYHLAMNDADLRYSLTPTGSRKTQLIIFGFLAVLPLFMGIVGTLIYHRSFSVVKFNELGRPETVWSDKHPVLAVMAKPHLHMKNLVPAKARNAFDGLVRHRTKTILNTKRKTVLIATMEYDIADWNIKIKIGGLGVISQLMAKHLEHLDLIWVVPCVGGIQYGTDQRAKPIVITILGETHSVQVQYHHVKNITYVILDAPVFRKQTKADPYPARMDDIESAVFYSAWNSCIAEVIKRFPIDLYHINDYHGAVAPLHILPRVIPCCLSLHNAEFQGLWAMRTPAEFDEVCRIYNLPSSIVRQYVQFGEVFNLLHAGASYLRIHQKGYGAAGVSAKYGQRSFARYPILWGLKHVGALPNPDPSDTADWDKVFPKVRNLIPEEDFEANRGALRQETQEWAGLKIDREAELFVFVGRWSMQKGIDLIADVFPAILRENDRTQLICVGPVIDLYGKFAALKLNRLMQMYPDRVYSKPEFTALPPCIFSGAEFCLIASRDEPFGLVAVEFGRKGALGVGARVGGLGNMPGWWYMIESAVSKHLIKQFKQAIQAALASKPIVRAQMRARAAKQRFPVAQWVEDLSLMQDTSIKISQRELMKNTLRNSRYSGPETPAGGADTPRTPGRFWGNILWGGSTNATASVVQSGQSTRAPSPSRPLPEAIPTNAFSLGTRHGPGHIPKREGRPRNRLSKRPPGSRDSSIGAQLQRFSRSRRPSRNSSPSSPKSSHQSSSMNAAPPGQAGSDTIIQGERNVNRVSCITETLDEDVIATASTSQGDQFLNMSDNIAGEPTHRGDSGDGSDEDASLPDEVFMTPAEIDESRNNRRLARLRVSVLQMELNAASSSMPPFAPPPVMRDFEAITGPGTPANEGPLLDAQNHEEAIQTDNLTEPDSAYLSLGGVLQGRKDYKLQSVEPFFTDPTGLYCNSFDKKLENLNPKNSEGQLCIETFLMKSEKDWFDRYHNVKMGKPPASTPASSIFRVLRDTSGNTASDIGSAASSSCHESFSDQHNNDNNANQFLLQENYKPPTGIKKYLLYRIGSWPAYSFLLAFGQIIAVNSYQITLLTGQVGQAAMKLYIIAAIYLLASLCWWTVFRTCKSLYVLAPPFAFYGLAFFLLGMSPFAPSIAGRGWVQNVATASYAVASASGGFYFSLNFGSEGSVPVATWSFRACAIQGSTQIYVVVLWFWGAKLTDLAVAGIQSTTLVAYGPGITAITVPIAVLLWLVGLIIYLGLPDYYRQEPGQIPSFYRSVMKRRIVIWFFITVLIQNFFLSAPYGRNWRYLFSSDWAPAGGIFALVCLFFIVVWATMLAIFWRLSQTHTWILPIFAISLGAPRWCQMWWSTSGMGVWLPWVGSPVSGALVGRGLWLWLGVLDAIQGVGFGMILLQTLTRFHVTFVLIGSQVLGSVATIVGRACAPDGDGPGVVFPNVVLSLSGLHNAWFWIAIIAQLVVCAGFAKWYRREQLMKP